VKGLTPEGEGSRELSKNREHIRSMFDTEVGSASASPVTMVKRIKTPTPLAS